MAKRGGRAEIDPKAEKRKLIEKWRNLLKTYVEFMLCAGQEDIAQDEAELDRLEVLIKASPKMQQEVLGLLDEIVNEVVVIGNRNKKQRLSERVADFRHVATELSIPEEVFDAYIKKESER